MNALFPRWLRLSFTKPRAVISLTALAAATMLTGVMAGERLATPPPVYAACHGANSACTHDATKTAVVDASYIIQGATTDTPVEPTSATTWQIVGYWSPAGLPCTDHTETATVDVSWNGSAWATSNFNGTANIGQAAVCNLSSCGSHAMAYRLYVDLNDPSTTGDNLRQVTFTATTVPNGTDYDYTTCATGSSRSPTASSFSATDTGSFECSFDCSQTGATVSLTYN